MITVAIADEAEDLRIVVEFFHALAEWDARQAADYGIAPKVILEFFHNDTDDNPLTKFFGEHARLFIAKWNGAPAGCVAFDRFDDERLELHRVYFAPQFRKKGVGRAMIGTALTEAGQTGFRSILVQTALFMDGAISLYEAMGFVRCPPFRAVPAAIAHAEVFMSRPLLLARPGTETAGPQ